jgi:hypothetical protein
VGADRESVPAGALGEPRVQVAIAELDNAVAPFADEVVVVAVAAEAIADLAWMMAERVDRVALAERGEGAVYGREADALASGGERSVDLLRRRVVALRCERGEDCEALPRRAKSMALEQLGCVRLPRVAHGV